MKTLIYFVYKRDRELPTTRSLSQRNQTLTFQFKFKIATTQEERTPLNSLEFLFYVFERQTKIFRSWFPPWCPQQLGPSHAKPKLRPHPCLPRGWSHPLPGPPPAASSLNTSWTLELKLVLGLRPRHAHARPGQPKQHSSPLGQVPASFSGTFNGGSSS